MFFASFVDVAGLALAVATPFASSFAVRRHLIIHRGKACRVSVPSIAGSPAALAASALSGVAAHRALPLLLPPCSKEDAARLLSSAASFLALCVSVPVATAEAWASSPGTKSEDESGGRERLPRLAPSLALLSASAAAALSCFHSVDRGAAALLLPLCCWAAFSLSLSLCSRHVARRSASCRGGSEGEGDDVDGAAAEGGALQERGLSGSPFASRARRLAGIVEVSFDKGGDEGARERAMEGPATNGDSAAHSAAPSSAVRSAPPSAPSPGGSSDPSAPANASSAPGDSNAVAPPLPPTLPPREPPLSDSLLPRSFSDPRAAGFRVRGPLYYSDRAKVSPRDSRGRLSVMELVSVPPPGIPHVARLLPSIRDSRAPFTFVWQVMVPGGGGRGWTGNGNGSGNGRDIAMVCAWELDYDPVQRVRETVERKRVRRERERRRKEGKEKKLGSRSSFQGSSGGSGGGRARNEAAAATDGDETSLDPSASAWGLVSPAPPLARPLHPAAGVGAAPPSADRATFDGHATERRRSIGDRGDCGDGGTPSNLFLPFTVGGHRRASTAAGAGDAAAAGDPFGSAESRSGSGAVPELAPASLRASTRKRKTEETKSTKSTDEGGGDGRGGFDDERGEGAPADESDDVDEDDLAGCDPFDLSLARFIEAGDGPSSSTERHARFKVIPRIDVGAWVVKRAVGQNTPVLLGNKVSTTYHHGPRYLEVDVDVGSSRTAAHVVGLVQGALKNLEISIAVLMEGKEQDELPESLLGTVKLNRIDLSLAPAFEPKV